MHNVQVPHNQNLVMEFSAHQYSYRVVIVPDLKLDEGRLVASDYELLMKCKYYVCLLLYILWLAVGMEIVLSCNVDHRNHT